MGFKCRQGGSESMLLNHVGKLSKGNSLGWGMNKGKSHISASWDLFAFIALLVSKAG